MKNSNTFTNNIGQVLNRGDLVLCVTTGYGHSVDTYEGIFLGVKNGRVQVMHRSLGNQYLLNPVTRRFEATGQKIVYQSIRTLNRNRVYKLDLSHKN